MHSGMLKKVLILLLLRPCGAYTERRFGEKMNGRSVNLRRDAGVYQSDGSRHSSEADDHGNGGGDCRAGVSGVVESHRPQIFRFLLASTRDVDLAETLTQECFLKAHRNWSSFRGESSAMTWLMRIAINLQKDHWRNRRMQFWRQTRSNAVDVDEASEWLPSGERTVEQQIAGAGTGGAGLEGG